MAERRMFAKKIIDSARFIKMPSETQSFYFHLSMRADDDGIVEAFSVMRLLGMSEDNLKILVAKEFVTVLNDDLVSHITDWKEHNLIRADRKVDSIYKNLLLQIIPDVPLIEKKARADRKHDGKEWDVNGTSMGLHSIVEDSIGKDRLVEVSIEDNVGVGQSSEVTIESYFDMFWRTYPNKKEKKAAKKAWDNAKDKPSIEIIINSIDMYKLSKEVASGYIKNPATWINKGCWHDEYKQHVQNGGLPIGINIFDVIGRK